LLITNFRENRLLKNSRWILRLLNINEYQPNSFHPKYHFLQMPMPQLNPLRFTRNSNHPTLKISMKSQQEKFKTLIKVNFHPQVVLNSVSKVLTSFIIGVMVVTNSEAPIQLWINIQWTLKDSKTQELLWRGWSPRSSVPKASIMKSKMTSLGMTSSKLYNTLRLSTNMRRNTRNVW